MALTRKFLSALGIEADKVDEIIASHTETVDGLKEEIKKYKETADKLPEAQRQLEDTQKELSELKETIETDGFEGKYNELKKEFDTFKTNIESKAIRESKEKAFKSLLKEAGVSEKRFDAIAKLSSDEIDKIELDEAGIVKDKDAIVKGIADNWSEFIQTTHVEGAKTATPPENNGGEKKQSSRAAKIAQQYHENLYGKTKED
jgi:coenzyme F420-reducing hydrogenase delta subunit